MLGHIYYASCTKNVIGSVNKRKTAQTDVQFSLPKIWRTRREKKMIEWGGLSFLPISSRLEKKRYRFWESNCKAFSRSKRQFTFHQEVCFHYPSPLAFSLISLWTTFGLPKTSIYKNHLENWLCSWWAEHWGRICETFVPTGKCS